MVGIQLTNPITQYGVSFGFATPTEATGVGTSSNKLQQTVRMALWPNEAAFGAYLEGGGSPDIGPVRNVAPIIDCAMPGEYLAVAYGLNLTYPTLPDAPSPLPTTVLGWLMWILTTAPETPQFHGTVVTI